MALPGQQAPKTGDNTAQPDNTRTNRADRAAGGPTAEQAKDNRSDREIMQKIRKDIVSDKSLSTYAHNVKVIADHGKVTLKGPVHTDDERKTIEAKATAVVGADNVTNDITVKADKSSSGSQQ
jgi:osmotically-inducible protein OsmY